MPPDDPRLTVRLKLKQLVAALPDHAFAADVADVVPDELAVDALDHLTPAEREVCVVEGIARLIELFYRADARYEPPRHLRAVPAAIVPLRKPE